MLPAAMMDPAWITLPVVKETGATVSNAFVSVRGVVMMTFCVSTKGWFKTVPVASTLPAAKTSPALTASAAVVEMD
jgi:hypothetical protein